MSDASVIDQTTTTTVENAVLYKEEDVQGLKAAKDALLKEKKEVQSRLQEAQKQLESYKDIDPDKYKAVMERLQQDELGKLLAEGKHEEYLNKRTELLRKDYDAQLSARDIKIQELEKNLLDYQEQTVNILINTQLREKAIHAGIAPYALEDVINRGRQTFQVDNQTGKAIARDENGMLIFGKDGVSPISIDEWLDVMRERAPHWYARTTGSGSIGTQFNIASGNGTGEIRTKADLRTSSDKAKFIQQYGSEAYLKLK